MNKISYLFFVFAVSTASAQNVVPTPTSKFPPPVTFTTEQDHQNMMQQLGIKALRPGPSGDETAPNHANYDEALANPYPNLPEVLTLKNGKKVTKPEQWWKQRRPEIIEDFEKLCKIPKLAQFYIDFMDGKSIDYNDFRVNVEDDEEWDYLAVVEED